MKRRVLLFSILAFALSLWSVYAFAQTQGSALASSAPLETTEELVYEGKLTRSLLRNVSIAEIRFTAQRTPQTALVKSSDNENATMPLLVFRGEAQSKGLLTKLFKLNFHQKIESTVEPGSFTVLQTNKVDDQNNRHRVSETVFDKTTGKLTWTEREPGNDTRPPRIVTADFNAPVQDIASIFYYIRTQPLEVGRSFEINVTDSGHVYRLPVKVVEKTQMKTVLGKVQVVRVDPEIFGAGRLIESKGSMSLWFTDDA
ncbi:MAG: DUF3108 domain-containing protein, partial [Pyrinomonadaceae bacterium]